MPTPSPLPGTGTTGTTGTSTGTTTVATTTTDQSSVLSSFLSTVESLVSLAPDALVKAIGLWTAARAAVQTVASGVAAAATQATVNTANAKYAAIPLTPPVLADMAVRNVVPDPTGAAGVAGSGYPPPMMSGVGSNSIVQEAALSGMNEDRLKALIAETGESYGIVDALRLWNRNVNLWALSPNPNYVPGQPLYVGSSDLGPTLGISQAELDAVIAYSRVRPQFTADLIKLAQNTLSPADCVELAVKQVVDTNTAQNLYKAAGGIPEQFHALVDAAGDAAGIEKSLSLFAHGEITEEEMTQVLGLSRMNPRFYYLAITKDGQPGPLNRRYLGAYEVGEALANGTITQAQAMTWLLDEGYPEDQAAAFATAKVTGTLTKPKEETASQVLKEYQAGLLTEAQTTTALTNLGYTSESVPYLLQYATAAAMVQARNGAVTRVKQAYLVGDLTASQAQADLGSLGVPSAAITAYMTDWTVEQQTPHLHLSAAQVGKLLEDGYIDAPTATAKWQAMGYGANDAALLLYIYPPGSKAAPLVPAPGAGTPAAPAS